MDRGGHLLKSYQLNTASTNVTTAAFVQLGAANDFGNGGAALVLYNGGSQIIGLFSGIAGAGGQVATIYPGVVYRTACLVPGGVGLAVKALSGATQSTGYLSVDVYG